MYPYTLNGAYGVVPKLTIRHQHRPVYKMCSMMLILAEHQVYAIYPLLMQSVSKFWPSADHIGHSLQHRRVKHSNNVGQLIRKIHWNTVCTCGRKLVPAC